ncbi:MAG: hypothetical protein M1575_03995 [Patescibacteria group bacterium]|nr:hypothetical protein [Patescibacteria group bacterium]MCL5095852.1 hypothetical protein [Patescibacteria group bacterium]
MSPTLDDFVRREEVSLPSELAGREVKLKEETAALLGATRGRISRTKTGEGFGTHKLDLLNGPLVGVTLTVDNETGNLYENIVPKGKERE